MAETLVVEARPEHGSRAARRLRKQGRVPAILYGHGQDNLSLAVPSEQIEAAVRHGSRFVNLAGTIDGREFSESALIAELQWNTWGTQVLHVDLHRVSAHEKVEVRVSIEIRGEAPGVKAGGVLEQVLHEIDLECPANAVPDHVYVRVNQLGLNGTITAKEIELPEGATLLSDPDAPVVNCTEPTAAEEAPAEGLGEAGTVEPELIRRKREEEEE